MPKRQSRTTEPKMQPVNALEQADSSIKDKELLLERRVHLIEVATRMLLSRGFSSISVNELASEAGFSIGSLYKYVRSKRDILWLVLDSIYRKFEQAFESEIAETDPVEHLCRRFEAYLRVTYSVRRELLLMYREFQNLSPEAQREFVERDRRLFLHFEELVQNGNKRGVWNCDPRMAALNLYATTYPLVFKGWLVSDIPIQKFIKQQTELMLEMLDAGANAPRPSRQTGKVTTR